MKSNKSKQKAIQYFFILMILLSGFVGNTQEYIQGTGTSANNQIEALISTGLFEEDEILQISLSGEMKDLLKDKSSNPQYYTLDLSYGDDNTNTIPVKVKTRGNFRRLLGNCSYLPLMIKFKSSPMLDKSVFRNQKKLKLVVPCSDERYLIREWLTYKLYNLINPNSFKVRLVKVQLIPKNEKGKIDQVVGFLLEDEKQLGKRLDIVRIQNKVLPIQLERENYLKMTLFQYLIGNTDWSVKYRQNIKIYFDKNSAYKIAIPYDFDFSGLVSSPYAKPPPALKLSSTRQRRYRGFCIDDINQYEEVLTHYNNLKSEIYSLFQNCELLEDKDLKSIEKFIDGFYKNINDPKLIERDLLYPCDPRGTGRVEIIGLQNIN